MALFQSPARTPEELEASRPLELPPEQVMEMDEAEWYRRAYRGEHAQQLTWRAVGMGSALGFFLAFTNLYIGLKTGWHLGVAITASILSFSIWGTLMRVGLAKTPLSILENNCMQSAASSAGYSTGGTLVSAFPALLLLSVTPENPRGTHLPWYVIASWTVCIAVLGVTLAIPMKRNMINVERLKFPSGVAAAVTLQSLYSKGQDALSKARALFVAGGVGMLLPLLKDLALLKETQKGKIVRHALLPGSTKLFDWLPGITVKGQTFALSDFNVKLDNSVALVAAGALIGLRVTLSMMAGAVVLVWFVAPAALGAEWTNAAGQVVYAAAKPQSAWKDIGVWIGAPMMVTSGLLSFATQWRTVVRAVKSTFGGGKKPAETDDGQANVVKQTEVPMAWFLVFGGLSGVGVVAIARTFFEVPVHLGVLAVVMTFFLALVACRATGETDVTPTGAMGKIMQLTYGVLIPQSTTANLMTAAITSGSASASADLLNDLKSGYLLGANPRRQFVAQLSGVVSGTVATTIGYFLLVPNATALTGVDGKDAAFAAPAAQQWKAVAEVFRVGISNLHPFAQKGIVVGVVVGAVLTGLELLLPRAKRFLPSPTGVGLGLILPFYYPLAMFIGALLAALARRVAPDRAERFIVPISSSLVAGESIIGVVVQGLNNFVLG
jgi:OPT family oligopeptide transporter